MSQKRKRSPWFIQGSVIFALFLRELKTRFETPGQYVWAIVEPLIFILFFLLLFLVVGRKSVGSITFPMFLLTGIVPWQLFSKSETQAMNAIPSNRGLFFYRQVKPIDTIMTRVFLELVVFVISYLILLFLYSLVGWAVLPADPLKLFAVYFIFVVFVFSFSLLLAVLAFFYDKALTVPLLFCRRILYFISGVFFPITVIPQQYREYLVWNPIFHVMELSRAAYFADYHTEYGSWGILIIITLALFVVSMTYYRVNRYTLLNPST